MSVEVINKNNDKRYKVYDIAYDKKGYPHFLIYKDGQWIRMSAKHFRPLTTEDITKELTEYVNNLPKPNLFGL